MPAYYTSAAQTTVYRSGSNVDTITQNQANYYSHISSITAYDISLTRGYHPAFSNDPRPYTNPVGVFSDGINGYGLCDMAGNLWEWCWDWQWSYSTSTQTDPRGPSFGSSRVNRGGCWASSSSAFQCRVAARGGALPIDGYTGHGFRSVLPPSP